MEGALAPPLGPHLHFRSRGGVSRALGPRRAGCRLGPRFPVAGTMEAPVEAESENEDVDSSCGDLCFMDKGLRR